MLHVVAVEDDRDSAWYFLMQLSRGGVDIVSSIAVPQLAVAAEWLWKHPTTTAVIDLMMPGLNGIEVAEWLRDNHPHVRRVLLTHAHPSDPRVKKAEDVCHVVLEKTVDPVDLLAAVQHDV